MTSGRQRTLAAARGISLLLIPVPLAPITHGWWGRARLLASLALRWASRRASSMLRVLVAIMSLQLSSRIEVRATLPAFEIVVLHDHPSVARSAPSSAPYRLSEARRGRAPVREKPPSGTDEIGS